MSGTSADGVDVALVEIAGRGLDMSARLIHHEHQPYDVSLKSAIFRVRDTGQVELAELARLGREISLSYATCVNHALRHASLPASELAAVAAHGQTLFHDPPGTIQWLDPSLITAEVGCAVVSDFRRADCAAGGQGAPLVPFADYILFRHPTTNRMIVNIGGIANVTCLIAGRGPEEIIAFDTGPGNCISDYLMRAHRPNSGGVDTNGQLAQRGKVIAEVFEVAKADPYFAKLGAKSTDVPSMIALWNHAMRKTVDQSRGSTGNIGDARRARNRSRKRGIR